MYSAGNYTEYFVITYMEKESEKKLCVCVCVYIYTHTHICITEALCCIPETNITL